MDAHVTKLHIVWNIMTQCRYPGQDPKKADDKHVWINAITAKETKTGISLCAWFYLKCTYIDSMQASRKVDIPSSFLASMSGHQ